jgi:hypothetical protein
MSVIVNKFIGDNEVDGRTFRLKNNTALRGRNAANSADVELLKVTTGDKLELQALPEALSSLPMPSAAKQFVTVEYVQDYIRGKGDAKDSCHALADSNIALTAAGALIVDAVNFGTSTTTPKKRIILTGQTAPEENGIYEYTYATGNYTLTRAEDANTSDKVTHGMYAQVSGGTNYSGSEALLTTADPIVLDTTGLVFAVYKTILAITAGDMMTKTGNDFAVDLATVSGLESTNPGNAAGQLRVKTDTGATEKDQTVKINASNQIVAKKSKKLLPYVLTGTDITNQYIDLPDVAADGSVDFKVAGAGSQVEGASYDFTVNYTGGASSKTRILFQGGLATGGASELVAGDIVSVDYMAY